MRKLRLNVFRTDAATAAARAHGTSAAEGLDVEVTLTPNSTDQMRGLSQGKYDMVSTAFDNVLAWSGREGAEIVTIAQISDKTVLPVFVRPEIKTWSDLKGKKLAADAVDTAFALVLRRVLLANGLDMAKGDYELVALGTTGARLESMIKGETFAGVLNPPFDSKALDAGMRRIGDSQRCLARLSQYRLRRDPRVGAEKSRRGAWFPARMVEGGRLGQRSGQPRGGDQTARRRIEAQSQTSRRKRRRTVDHRQLEFAGPASRARSAQSVRFQTAKRG